MTVVILNTLLWLTMLAIGFSGLVKGFLTVGEFVTYKAIFGVLLGFVVTPIVALWALSEAGPAEP